LDKKALVFFKNKIKNVNKKTTNWALLVETTSIAYGIKSMIKSKALLFMKFIYNNTVVNTSKRAGGLNSKNKQINDRATKILENLMKKYLLVFCGKRFLSET
jgi:hypothetical protein